MTSPGQQVPNMLLEISGEITPERMKSWGQSNKAQFQISLVMEGKSDAVKSSIAQEPGMSGPGDGKSKRRHFRNQQTKMDWNG